MQSQAQQTGNSFLKPFPLEQLRADILRLSFMHARLGFLFADPKELGRAHFGRTLTVPMAFADVEAEPADLGLSYADVRHTDFAQALERQYNYAFLALSDGPGEFIDYETSHTWVAAQLLDFERSLLVYELSTYGAEQYEESIQRCLYVCELANARIVLEGQEPFTYLRDANRRPDEKSATSIEGLTVRQLALLAGMEEMTIRTAVSRKGPNQLVSRKDGNRTVFEPHVAKDWLISKGRYIAVRRGGLPSKEELLASAYPSREAFIQMLNKMLESAEKAPSFWSLLPEVRSTGEISLGHLKDDALMRSLGEALGMPSDLFAARAREAAVRDELTQVARQIETLRL